MNYQVQPLNILSMQETADLFNRSFESYFIPVRFTVDTFVAFVQRDRIDFDASQVLIGDNQPVGLALIARRGKASRIGGFGIIKNLRNQGAGSWFVECLLGQARLRNETHVFLEVITQNQAAVRLYEKYGFTRIRQLLGFKAEKPNGIADETLQECSQALVLDMSRGYCLPDLPWQLDAETLGSVPSFGYRLENAFTLISNPEAEHIGIRTLVVPAQAHGQGQATRLLGALFAKYPGKVWQIPAIFPEEMGGTFLRAGMQLEKLSQWQMVCRL